MTEIIRDEPSNRAATACGVPENPVSVAHVERAEAVCRPEGIVAALQDDRVVLIEGVSPQEADDVIAGVAQALNLRNELELQAAFASSRGKRGNIGKYFMSVNERSNYQFIGAHSEGNRSAGMQLASFYCYENSTDGGVSISMRVNDESPAWNTQRAFKVKVDLCGKRLSPAEIASARMMHFISIPDDLLREDDQVIEERPSPIPGIKTYAALERPRTTFSRILQRDVKVYWDNVASIDFDAAKEYLRMLRSCGLFVEPAAGMTDEHLDYCLHRRVWNSGVRYEDLFTSRVTRKLLPGDLVIQNNLTWTHSCSNWTPGSGTRKVAVAFA